MNRRMFLKVSAAVPAAVAASQLPGLASVARAQQKEFTPRPGTWRTFEITTRVEVLAALRRRAGLAARSVRGLGLPADDREQLGGQCQGDADR